MALVHDMAECIVGDLTPYDDISVAEKHKHEQVCQCWTNTITIREMLCYITLRNNVILFCNLVQSSILRHIFLV